MRRQPSRPAARGMTLLELMVAMAVAGILAAVAYPSYMESVRKGRRSEAQAVLLEASQFMERFATENLRYDRTLDKAAAALPSTLARAPKGSSTPHYTIELETTRDSYVLSAVPRGSMVGDSCGTMTLSQTGVQGASKPTCWRR